MTADAHGTLRTAIFCSSYLYLRLCVVHQGLAGRTGLDTTRGYLEQHFVAPIVSNAQPCSLPSHPLLRHKCALWH